MIIAVISLIAGCSTSVHLGRLPDSLQLEQGLNPGISGKAGVEKFLGTPRGGGRVLLPGDEGARDLWYYYHEEATATEDRRIFLFIFFSKGKYDGYLWFSSLPWIPVTENESH
jgi:hypothetical protein